VNSAGLRHTKPGAHLSTGEHGEGSDSVGELARREVIPENIKQSLVQKVRSTFEQPGEEEGADALRIVLVERGGLEVAARWVPLLPLR
jgi:hypothetical protein